jgi:hypothetical protein
MVVQQRGWVWTHLLLFNVNKLGSEEEHRWLRYWLNGQRLRQFLCQIFLAAFLDRNAFKTKLFEINLTRRVVKLIKRWCVP